MPASPSTLPVASPPGRSLRRDAAQNRVRLLKAAEEVFAKSGLSASVDEVARVAGVGMGTLYRRFPTKDALIRELVVDLTKQILGIARQAQEVPDGAGLESFLFATADLMATNRGCLARLWDSRDADDVKDECRAVIAGLLADAKAHDRFRPEAEIGDIDLLFWSLRGVLRATQGLSTSGSRRHIAVMIAGWRPSPDPLPEPPLSPEQTERIRRGSPST
jgi:AcrR family transcriptional regulator